VGTSIYSKTVVSENVHVFQKMAATYGDVIDLILESGFRNTNAKIYIQMLVG
jgi:hypothetical protein